MKWSLITSLKIIFLLSINVFAYSSTPKKTLPSDDFIEEIDEFQFTVVAENITLESLFSNDTKTAQQNGAFDGITSMLFQIFETFLHANERILKGEIINGRKVMRSKKWNIKNLAILLVGGSYYKRKLASYAWQRYIYSFICSYIYIYFFVCLRVSIYLRKHMLVTTNH